MRGPRAQAKTQDPRLLYNAARVYCQAAALLEADPARSRGEWAVAGQLPGRVPRSDRRGHWV